MPTTTDEHYYDLQRWDFVTGEWETLSTDGTRQGIDDELRIQKNADATMPDPSMVKYRIIETTISEL
jgi:hypothetical protein